MLDKRQKPLPFDAVVLYEDVRKFSGQFLAAGFLGANGLGEIFEIGLVLFADERNDVKLLTLAECGDPDTVVDDAVGDDPSSLAHGRNDAARNLIVRPDRIEIELDENVYRHRENEHERKPHSPDASGRAVEEDIRRRGGGGGA